MNERSETVLEARHWQFRVLGVVYVLFFTFPEEPVVDLDRTDPVRDIALNKARPWQQAGKRAGGHAGRPAIGGVEAERLP